MKKVINIIIIGMCFSNAFAQEINDIYVVKMDSLQQLVVARSKNDKEKVRLLNEYARQCFFNQEFHKGLIAARHARDLSNKLGFEGGQVMYYLTLAAFHGIAPMYTYYQKKAQWISMQNEGELLKYYTDVVLPSGYPPTLSQSLNDKLLASYQYFKKIGDYEIQAALTGPICRYYFQSQMPQLENYIDTARTLYSKSGQIYPYLLYTTRFIGFLTAQGKTNEARKIELELVDLVAKSNDKDAFGLITSTMATHYANSGRNAMAIEYYIKAADAYQKTGDLDLLAETYRLMGLAYENIEMNSKASEAYTKYVDVAKKLKDSTTLYSAYNYMVSPLISLKKHNEARKYMALALHDKNPANRDYLIARNNDAEGRILVDQLKYAEAISYFEKAFTGFSKNPDHKWSVPFMPLYIAECYQKTGNAAKALEYGLQCLDLENKLQSNRTVIKARVSLVLSEIYDKMGNLQKAFEFLKMHQQIKSESEKQDEANRVADAEINSILEKSQNEIDALEKQRIQNEQESKNQKLWIMSIAGAFLSAVVLSFVLYKNNRSKQKANTLLNQQKAEIQESISKLKATQKQLIQSEKMASLGELTAGIAHEIQNPLNFVNNFSEVNKELVEELEREAGKGNLESVKAIAKDIKGNEDKINHHGKRADAIVKGMLQHSRSSSAVKEPTDINKLVDEYLRLAYHGLRAKDNFFNATIKTDFHETVGNINIIPQDLGRAILNLITNAFYAVREKKKQAGNTYEPTVSIGTKKTNDGVEIRVADNGGGIPQKILDKIFQPFFTTKPTGQGTGLGLSLSYDIVKAHSGEIKVETKEGEGAAFIIQLPIN